MEEKEYTYMVGIISITFNQSKFILDTLNGFVMQQTNFPFVAMVIDDASTDGEQEVIKKFVTKQFDTTDTTIAYEKETDYAHITYARHKTNKNCYMAVLYLKENHYSQRKPKRPYLAEWQDHVKYEALCEGDDYWIDAQKLQKQVDFLEEHEEYGLVYGKAKEYIQKENKLRHYTIGTKREGFEDSLISNGICTLTTLYRIDALDGYNDFVKEEMQRAHWKMGDYPLWLYISHKYKIHFFDEIFAVYRVLENSASHSTSFEKQIEFINSVYDVKYFFAEKYCNDLKNNLKNNKAREIFHTAVSMGKKEEAKIYFSKIQKPTTKEYIKYINFLILPYNIFTSLHIFFLTIKSRIRNIIR